MTEDEQEALSARWIMPRIMRLSSGNFALLIDGEPLKIIQYDDILALVEAIPTYEALAAYHESLRASRPRPGRIRGLNLADLGL